MLDLIWTAKFKDGSTLQQYDIVEKELEPREHKFQEVLDRQEDLELFALTNIKYGYSYIVSLINGTINISSEGSIPLTPDEDMLKENYKYRLIYFRRISKNFGSNFKQIGETEIVYFLGFQYNLKDGSNVKRLMKIDKYGKVVIN